MARCSNCKIDFNQTFRPLTELGGSGILGMVRRQDQQLLIASMPQPTANRTHQMRQPSLRLVMSSHYRRRYLLKSKMPASGSSTMSRQRASSRAVYSSSAMQPLHPPASGLGNNTYNQQQGTWMSCISLLAKAPLVDGITLDSGVVRPLETSRIREATTCSLSRPYCPHASIHEPASHSYRLLSGTPQSI